MTDTSKSSQVNLIEQHLKSGKPITPIEALNLYGCFRLGARIWDLKSKGLNIITTMIKDGRKKYAQYSLSVITPVMYIGGLSICIILLAMMIFLYNEYKYYNKIK